MTSETVGYLFRKYDYFVRNMNVSKKGNYWFQKCDLIQEYAKVTPKCDEPHFFECFGGKQLNQ